MDTVRDVLRAAVAVPSSKKKRAVDVCVCVSLALFVLFCTSDVVQAFDLIFAIAWAMISGLQGKELSPAMGILGKAVVAVAAFFTTFFHLGVFLQQYLYTVLAGYAVYGAYHIGLRFLYGDD